MSSPPALAGAHTVLPLWFKPTALNGISEKMIVSHHDNNYAGAVKNLNKVEQELSQINADTPPFVVAGLRQSELTFRNSKTLHEAYFGNLGGDGKRSGAIEKALSDAYGASSRWEEQFRATGAGLGGGSGVGHPGARTRDDGLAHVLVRQPHAGARDEHPVARHGHVRARLPDGLRCCCGEVHRHVLHEHSLGRGESSL